MSISGFSSPLFLNYATSASQFMGQPAQASAMPTVMGSASATGNGGVQTMKFPSDSESGMMPPTMPQYPQLSSGWPGAGSSSWPSPTGGSTQFSQSFQPGMGGQQGITFNVMMSDPTFNINSLLRRPQAGGPQSGGMNPQMPGAGSGSWPSSIMGSSQFGSLLGGNNPITFNVMMFDPTFNINSQLRRPGQPGGNIPGGVIPPSRSLDPSQQGGPQSTQPWNFSSMGGPSSTLPWPSPSNMGSGQMLQIDPNSIMLAGGGNMFGGSPLASSSAALASSIPMSSSMPATSSMFAGSSMMQPFFPSTGMADNIQQLAFGGFVPMSNIPQASVSGGVQTAKFPSDNESGQIPPGGSWQQQQPWPQQGGGIGWPQQPGQAGNNGGIQTQKFPSDTESGQIPPGGNWQQQQPWPQQGGGIGWPQQPGQAGNNGGIQTQKFPSDSESGQIPPGGSWQQQPWPPQGSVGMWPQPLPGQIGGTPGNSGSGNVQTLKFPSDNESGQIPPGVIQYPQHQLPRGPIPVEPNGGIGNGAGPIHPQPVPSGNPGPIGGRPGRDRGNGGPGGPQMQFAFIDLFSQLLQSFQTMMQQFIR